MIRFRTASGSARLLLGLGILEIIVGIVHIGPWAGQGRDALARYIGPPLNVRFVGTLHLPDHEGPRGNCLAWGWNCQKHSKNFLIPM
jgi:hypothetical protein